MSGEYKSHLGRAFRAACKRAGIENFRFHDLRHTVATKLSQSGTDIYAIANLLGHKDMRMTQRYAHHSVDSLKKDVSVLDKTDCNLTVVAENEGGFKTVNRLKELVELRGFEPLAS